MSKLNMAETNYNEALNKIKKLSGLWATRELTLYGRAEIINNTLLSKL